MNKYTTECVCFLNPQIQFLFSFFSKIIQTGKKEEVQRLDADLVRRLREFMGVTNGNLDNSTTATLAFLYIYLSLFGSGWDISNVLRTISTVYRNQAHWKLFSYFFKVYCKSSPYFTRKAAASEKFRLLDVHALFPQGTHVSNVARESIFIC